MSETSVRLRIIRLFAQLPPGTLSPGEWAAAIATAAEAGRRYRGSYASVPTLPADSRAMRDLTRWALAAVLPADEPHSECLQLVAGDLANVKHFTLPGGILKVDKPAGPAVLRAVLAAHSGIFDMTATKRGGYLVRLRLVELLTSACAQEAAISEAWATPSATAAAVTGPAEAAASSAPAAAAPHTQQPAASEPTAMGLRPARAAVIAAAAVVWPKKATDQELLRRAAASLAAAPACTLRMAALGTIIIRKPHTVSRPRLGWPDLWRVHRDFFEYTVSRRGDHTVRLLPDALLSAAAVALVVVSAAAASAARVLPDDRATLRHSAPAFCLRPASGDL